MGDDLVVDFPLLGKRAVPVVAIYGTVEMGGTKTSCAIGSSPDDLSRELTRAS